MKPVRTSRLPPLTLMVLIVHTACVETERERPAAKTGQEPDAAVSSIPQWQGEDPGPPPGLPYGVRVLRFREAIRKGEHEEVRAMLEEHPELGNSLSRNRLTPLHHAVYHSQVEVASVLLEYGADVNAEDGSGQAPLHEAARRSADMVELLLRHGAHADPVTWDGLTPLQLLVYGCSRRPSDVVERAERLVRAGADVNVVSNGRWGGLLTDARNRGCGELAEFLRSRGAR